MTIQEFKNVAIEFGNTDVVVTGLVTGYNFLVPSFCPGCARQIFIEMFDKSSMTYIGVKQIRCDSGPSIGFASFRARFGLSRTRFEGLDIELRASFKLDYCDTFTGKFDPKLGRGLFKRYILMLLTLRSHFCN